MDVKLSDGERMALARAVYALTGYPPPKSDKDLSMVKSEIEVAVERIIKARVVQALRDAADEMPDIRDLTQNGILLGAVMDWLYLRTEAAQ